jgi:hypothetical protein
MFYRSLEDEEALCSGFTVGVYVAKRRNRTAEEGVKE